MKYAICLAAAALAFSVAGCKLASSPAQQETGAPDAKNPLEVRPHKYLLDQIKTGEPEWTAVTESLRVPGRVETDETRVARVGSPVTGRIATVLAVEGQTVRKGQILAELNSTELADAQKAFLKAQAQRDLAQRAAARAVRLLAEGVIADAEKQRRESELAQATTEVSALSDQLHVLGMSEEAVSVLEMKRVVRSQSQIAASIDGTVMERKATVGQVVQAADTVFVIADLSELWLIAEVPELSARLLRVNKAVEAEISAYPDQPLRGVLSYVSTTVHPESRTVRVRMEIANRDGRLKPSMLATMVLQDQPQTKQVVPSAAVVRELNRDQVFVQDKPGVFVMREVTLGGEHGDQRVLLDGLKPGEKIALNNAFHLNTERKKAAMQAE